MGRDAFPLWMDEKRMTARNKSWQKYGFLQGTERKLTGRRLYREETWKRAGTKKGAPRILYPRDSSWKEAATYSPALHCSTIGASGLNFSVRNGKRWDPTAITTWCLVFSSQVCFSWRVDCWLVDKLSVLLIVHCFYILSSNLFTRLPSTC